MSIVERTVRVDAACDACGLCVAACPSGALESAADPSARVVERVVRAARGGCARVLCERTDAPGAAERVGCLGRLDEATVLGVFAQAEAHTLELFVGDCATCDRREGLEQVWPPTLAAVTAALDHAPAPRRTLIVRRGPASTSRPNLARRRMLSALFGRVRRTGDRAAGPVVARPARAAAARRALVGRSALLRPSALPVVSRACIGCEVCVHVCPTGALRRDPSGGRVTLSLSAELCTGCGLCVEACLPAAMSLDVRHEVVPVALAVLTARTCEACGDSFFHAADDVATRCFGCRPRWTGDAGPRTAGNARTPPPDVA